MNVLGIKLKQLRESRNLTILELADKSKTGNGTIGNIERGANRSTPKTLEKISKALNLNSNERDELMSCLLPNDIGNKINVLNKKNKELEEELNLNKREKLQYDDFMSSATLMFNDESISDEDKEKLFRSLQEVFFETKLLNKKKKSELK
ncbi:MAG: helix-turn-helix domain-containing protein [Fusobacteriaceae bacterium]